MCQLLFHDLVFVDLKSRAAIDLRRAPVEVHLLPGYHIHNFSKHRSGNEKLTHFSLLLFRGAITRHAEAG
jgi:hypothetical protein